jgi:hypothetical protein
VRHVGSSGLATQYDCSKLVRNTPKSGWRRCIHMHCSYLLDDCRTRRSGHVRLDLLDSFSQHVTNGTMHRVAVEQVGPYNGLWPGLS